MAVPSKTQIDRLGERLKSATPTEDDLRMLDEYRRTFSSPCDKVVGAIRSRLALEPTGRPAKSTQSIIDKLQRESVRLSQIQDIAGCRVVVEDLNEQDATVASLTSLFEQCVVVDRRKHTSHGYRAVHVVIRTDALSVEVQVRTRLQHLWAEFSEKTSDALGSGIKYGMGNEAALFVLQKTSANVQGVEELQRRAAKLPDGTLKATLMEDLNKLSEDMRSLLRGAIDTIGGIR